MLAACTAPATPLPYSTATLPCLSCLPVLLNPLVLSTMHFRTRTCWTPGSPPDSSPSLVSCKLVFISRRTCHLERQQWRASVHLAVEASSPLPLVSKQPLPLPPATRSVWLAQPDPPTSPGSTPPVLCSHPYFPATLPCYPQCLAGPTRLLIWPSSTRRRCWRRGTTSSSSGWLAWS